MAAETPRLPRLPACRHCSTKKIRCDSSRPKCAICMRNGIDCVMYDSASQEWVSREYIEELEKLAGQVNDSGLAANNEAAANDQISPTHASPEKINTVRSMGSSTTMTRGAGISFISLLFSDADWRRSNADLLKSLNHTSQTPERAIEPCALPSSTVAKELFERYLNWSHILNPILLRHEVWELYGRVFPQYGAVSTAASHDLFRAFIICAIASVIPHRTGLHPQHPGGYYRAALQNIGPHLLTRGLDSIQDLLLIGRFGVYHHIGISIWELVQLCGRLCTEQGLHCGDQENGVLLHDQKQRRVFWQVYLIDRYSSITLDRPFAIADASIEIGLPIDVDDNDLASASPSLRSLDAFSQCLRPTKHTEVTVFLFCVKLRQLSSRIHAKLATLRQDPSLQTQPYLAVGRICATLNGLLQELEQWYESAPKIPNPRCLYESPEWFTLLFCRERIDLLRRAVDLIPKANGAPPRHVVSLFLRAALTVIHTYSTMSESKSFITYTRNYFHMMFTAGLSVLYCTSVSHQLSPAELYGVVQGLQTCETTLTRMSEQPFDARSYTAVFAALHRHFLKKINRTYPAHEPSATNEDVAGDVPGQYSRAATESQFHDQNQHSPNVPDLSFDSSMSNMAESGWLNMPIGGFVASTNMFTGNGSQMENLYENGLGGGIGDSLGADDDLLQWAFLHDESVWSMDMMLGEYAYGDPVHSGPLNGVNM